MIVNLLLAYLADRVFKAAASKDRVVAGKVARYFEQRGLAQRRAPRPVPTR